MANTILFIGKEEDPHIKEVYKHVKAMDNEVRVVVFDPFCGSHFIEISVGNPAELTPSCTIVVDDGERIAAETIRSVWYRFNSMAIKIPEPNNDLQGVIAKDFKLREWQSVLRSLASYLPHARWVNPLEATELLDCKPYQLNLAQQVGLTVPKTAITNNPTAVEKLFDEVDNKRVVYKTLERLLVSEDKMMFTAEITKEFPSTNRAGMTQCPDIYQELVERRSDLRITVVGQELFVARIASQTLDEKKDRLDWRRCQEKEELYSKAQVQ